VPWPPVPAGDKQAGTQPMVSPSLPHGPKR
jgi:hypothetical protein